MADQASEDATQGGEGESPEAASGAAAATKEPFAWQGHKLDEMRGAQVGRVEGQATGTAEWLVARMGRFGHYCLVPGRDAVAANGHVWVPYTRDQIRRAPRVDPKAPLDDESERATLTHYGLET